MAQTVLVSERGQDHAEGSSMAEAVKSVFLDANILTGDKKAFGPWMNKPSKTGGLIIQTIRHFFDSLKEQP